MAAAVLATGAPVTNILPNMIGVTASAAETLTDGDYSYIVNDDGETVTITKYTGTDAEVDIPATLGGKTVTEIDTCAFSTYSAMISLEGITIPDSVTTIMRLAFLGCTSLETITVGENNANYSSINGVLFNKDKSDLVCYPAGKKDISYAIPDSVTKIGESAFDYCKLLTNVTIPDSVTDISQQAFCRCTSLTSVTIPGSVTTITGNTFSMCTSLTSVTILDGVTKIYLTAFNKCTSLTSVTIPDSVRSIANGAFDGCTSLEDVYYGGSKCQWEKITVDERNEYLLNATIHFAKEAHTLEKHEAVSATCSTEGNDVYWECSNCGKLFSDENATVELDDIPTIAKTAHTWNDGVVTTQPTISTEGVKTYTCTICSVTKTEAIPLFDKDNETTTEVEMPPEAADIPDDDKIVSIRFNNAFNMSHKNGNNVELDLSKLEVKARAIYDEAGLKRASEALGTTISGNTHYNLLDLTLLYNGKDFSNGYNGLVQVIIPIPNGHKDKFFSCYRIVEKNGKKTKELIPGEQTEDSYIIYLEHFSEYALVASDTKQEHVHTWDDGVVTKQPTTSSEGVKTYTCTVCSETRTEAIAKLPSSSGGSGSRPSGGSGRPSGGSSSTTPPGMTDEETFAVIRSTESGAAAKINGNIFMIPEIINEAVKKNVDLQVRVDNYFTWNIDTDKLGAIDTALRLSITKNNADSDIISKIKQSADTINKVDKSFSTLAKNLGTGATLTVKTSEKPATSIKMFANLYKEKADGVLEFVSAAPIDDYGYTTLPIFETANYTIIMSTETKKPGDINNDCKVDLTDLTAMLKKYVNSQSLSITTDFKMDYDNDGKCRLTDITLLLRDYVNNKV